ncbi:putative helicase SKI2W [Apostichopus japonicus]|uniref:Putative helicase SKI2W n=1 Tax=Stichopus japonicus TaxID=307972 RepID=A0A2G8LKP6_STIJA|nr:putative helicase SKI2W [Apostichopus japonicus]
MLSSQFRLTYTMILHVLRVSEIRVEDMMRHSFLEFDALEAQADNKEKAKTLASELQTMEDVDCYLCNIDLKEYYSGCKFLTEARRKFQNILLTHPTAIKHLAPGRVIIVKNSKHNSALGVVLKSPSGMKKKFVTSLVICEENSNASGDDKQNGPSNESHVQPIKKEALFHPEGPCGHVIEDLEAEDILGITHNKITIKPDAIIDNYKKRKLPRFSQDPPGQSTVLATQELLRLTEANPEGLETVDAVKDFHIRDMELVRQYKDMQNLDVTIGQFDCLGCSQFDDHFATFSKKMKMFEDQEHFNFLSCDDSLQLIPEYHQRIQVLQELGHISNKKTLELKGRVACEMNIHELVITELVFRNILSPLEPGEIAALLSCTVFQDRRCNEPDLTETLKQGVEKIKAIAQEIGEIQYNCQVKLPPSEFVEQYRFGLTEVVYQWAKGMVS